MKMKNLFRSSLIVSLSILSAGFLHSALATTAAAELGRAGIDTDVTKTLKPLPEHTNTTRHIVDALSSRHYVDTVLDDALSSKIFDGYINGLDPSRSYFLASDIESFEYLRFEMDNALRKGDVSAAFEIFNTYQARVVTRFEKVVSNLELGVDQFDFTIDEELILDREEEAWAQTDAELDDLWRKRVKHAVLNLRLAEKEPEKIQELLLKRYENRLSRTIQTNSEDIYQIYMNAFTKTYDPHTQYFSPRTSENFNINMSLSLEGIGAVLQREDEHTRVVSLVPKGPADKSNSLFPDDKIVGVGQGAEGQIVDVVGWRLDEVVELIRGKKDTVVRLDVIPAEAKDSSSKVIEITRNTVKLEEQSAKSEIIEVEHFGAIQKIGVIDIPTFYIDFKALQQGDKNYKSTTSDVRKLLVDLMEEGVEGVVIDLRNNGGGSLQEAKTLTGLFIDRGPTVQIRSKSNRVDILNDRDIRTIYDGPMAVLVNRLSASASEIFAGALQDYERAVVVGSQTFGKGTVQSLIPLNRGQLKLTQAKFYRISGESTQHKGIVPDISFPANFDPEQIGESTLDSPLPWDHIKPTSYRIKGTVNPLLADLQSMHNKRAALDPEFIYLRDALAYRQVRSNENTISLNEQARLREKDSADTFWLALENTKRLGLGLDPVASLDDLDNEDEPVVASVEQTPSSAPGLSPATNGDTSTEDQSLLGNEIVGVGFETNSSNPAQGSDDIENPHQGAKGATLETTEDEQEPDPFLVETSKIVLDMIGLENRTAKKSMKEQRL
jgi:carboxyl-terminal processing protease|tara:strand:+ start:228 stop:2564 length:2337 start_codon:yes stop_codon:yes gene_type:complete